MQSQVELEIVKCGVCGSSDSKWLFDAADYIYGNKGRWPYAQCNSCSVVFMNPRIPPKRIGEFYPKQYYTNQCAVAPHNENTFRSRLKKTLQITQLGYPMPNPRGSPAVVGILMRKLLMKTPAMRRQIKRVPNGRVLDVGCGNGEMLDQYRALGWQTTGIEPGPESAQIARKKGHCVITGVAEEANLPLESFDAITLWDALEHIPNPDIVVQKLFKLLAPRGHIYIHVPNYGSIYAKFWRDRWFMFTAPLHYFHYSATTLTYLLTKNGFVSVTTATGLGEVGWRQSILSGIPNHAVRSRVLRSSFMNRISNLIEQGLPGGHLTAIARKPATQMQEQ